MAAVCHVGSAPRYSVDVHPAKRGEAVFARVSRYRGDAERMRAGFESVTAELEQIDGFHQAFFLRERFVLFVEDIRGGGKPQ